MTSFTNSLKSVRDEYYIVCPKNEGDDVQICFVKHLLDEF